VPPSTTASKLEASSCATFVGSPEATGEGVVAVAGLEEPPPHAAAKRAAAIAATAVRRLILASAVPQRTKERRRGDPARPGPSSMMGR
jgi:hypothetical protein